MAKPKFKKITFTRNEEFQFSITMQKQLHDLISKCFSEYPEGKTFLKQAPHFRILARSGKKLVGQIAVDYRHINNGGQTAAVFCLSDVCVHPDYQSQKIGSKMLELLEKEAIKNKLDFMLLTATETGLYYKNGFRIKNNIFRWLMIQGMESLGLNQRRLEKTVMVKRFSKQKWSKAIIDLAGPIF